MNSPVRDASLDIIKGGACFFMIVAHLPIFEVVELPVRIFIHIAGLFTGIFFGAAGITASFQAQKYSYRSLALYFGVLFLVGASWNVLVHGDSSSFLWIEIFQIIAIGSLGACWVERNGPAPQWLLLFIASILVAIKFTADEFWPEFDGWNYLFCDNEYVPHGELFGQKGQLFPGFALFPWLSFFFLGIFFYRLSKAQKLYMALFMVLILIISVQFGSDPMEKWDTTVAYVIGCSLLLVLSLWLFHGGMKAESWFARSLNMVGVNVLLFFFVHPIGLVGGFLVYKVTGSPYLAWPVAVVLAFATLVLLLRVKPSKYFTAWPTWCLAIFIIFFFPILTFVFDQPLLSIISRVAALVVGILVAINIHHLAVLTKRKLN